jgi:hypothetical protein
MRGCPVLQPRGLPAVSRGLSKAIPPVAVGLKHTTPPGSMDYSCRFPGVSLALNPRLMALNPFGVPMRAARILA